MTQFEENNQIPKSQNNQQQQIDEQENNKPIDDNSTNIQINVQMELEEASFTLQDNKINLNQSQNAIQQNQQIQENLNVIKVGIQGMKLFFTQVNKKVTEIEFYCMNIQGSYFLYKNDIFLGAQVQENVEVGFMGELGIINEGINNKYKQSVLIKDQRQIFNTRENRRPSQIFRQNYQNEEENQEVYQYLQNARISANIIMYKEGNTTIDVKLQNFKLLVNSYVIFSAINFIQSDELLQLQKISKNKNQSSGKPEKKKSQNPQPITINLKTNNILIAAESEPNKKQIVGFSIGKVNVVLEQNTENNNHQLFHRRENGDKEVDESNVFCQNIQNSLEGNISINLKVKDIEVSSFLTKDIYQNKIDLQSRKRSILKPFKVDVKFLKFNCNCSEENMIIQEINVNLEKINCNISYKAIHLLYSTMIYQEILKENAKVFENTYRSNDDDQVIYLGSIGNIQQSNIHREYENDISQRFDQQFRNSNNQDYNTIWQSSQKQTNMNSQYQMPQVQQRSYRANYRNNFSGAKIDNAVNNRTNLSARQIKTLDSMQVKPEQIKKKEIVYQVFTLTGLQFELFLTNDFDQSFVPVLHLNFEILPNIKFVKEQSKGFAKGVFIFNIEYFNPFVGKMEPIIEQSSLKFLFKFDQEREQQYIDISTNSDDQLQIKPIMNINISDRMILVLFQSIQILNKQFISTQTKLNQEMGRSIIPQNMQQSIQNSQPIHPIMSRQSTKFSFQVGEQDYQKDYATLFSFQNMTGYLVTVKKLQQDQTFQQINVESGQTLNFQVETDQDDFAKTFDSNYKVMVNFETRGGYMYEINDIILDRERQDVYLWNKKKIEQRNFIEIENLSNKSNKSNSSNQHNKIIKDNFNQKYLDQYTFQQQKHHFFLSEIKLKDLKKTIILSSCFIIQNNLGFTVNIKLQNNHIGEKQFILDPNQIGPIPYEFMDSNTLIFIQPQQLNNQVQQQSYTTPYNLLYLLQIKDNQFREINNNQFTCVMKKQQDPVVKNRVMLVLDTLLTFQNLLPIPININYKNLYSQTKRLSDVENSRSSLENNQYPNNLNDKIYLLPQQIYKENHLQSSSQIEIQAQIVGYSLSDNFLVYEKDTKEKSYPKKLTLKDQNGKKQIINIERVVDGGSIKIMFYCKMCFVNTSDVPLTVYETHRKNVEILQGQTGETFQTQQSINSLSNASLVFNNSIHESPNKNMNNSSVNKSLKYKPIFTSNPRQQRSSIDYRRNSLSYIQQEDQYQGRVILLNDDDDKIALSLQKTNQAKGISKKDNIFAPISIKHLIKEQEPQEIQLRINESDISNSSSSDLSSLKANHIYDFSVEVSQQQLNDTNLVTKVLTVSPKYVIVNQAPFDIEVGTNEIISVQPNQRIAQKWIKSFQYQLMTRPSPKYHWSGSIPLEEIKTYNFYCISQSQTQTKAQSNQEELHFMTAQVEQVGPTTYIIIKDVQEENIPYMFINDSEEIKISITQALNNITEKNKNNNQNISQDYNVNDKFSVYPQHQAKFAWQFPCHGSKIEAILEYYQLNDFYFLNNSFSVSNTESLFKPIENKVIIDLQDTDFEDKIVCELKEKNRTIGVLQRTTFKGMTRVITFSEFYGEDPKIHKKRIQNQKKKERNTQSQTYHNENPYDDNYAMYSYNINFDDEGMKLNLNIKDLGISFICNYLGQNKELNYISIRDTNIELLQNKDFRDITLDVKFIQIDNNTDEESISPINLTPQFYRSIVENDQNKTIFLNLRQNIQAQSVQIIENFELFIAPLQFKIDQDFLQIVYKCSKNMIQSMNEMKEKEEDDDEKKDVITDYSVSQYLFESQQRRQQMEKKLKNKDKLNSQASFFEDWRFRDLPEVSKDIFINQLQIGEISICFSYYPSFVQVPEKFYLVNTLANVVGTTIGNIADAPIKISRYQSKEGYNSQNNIKKQIIKHYALQAIKQLIRIIGSFEIIGNPAGFISKIGDGIEDLTERPLNGIRQGPMEFGMCIQEGTGSFFNHGIAGTFQSINSVTGTISTGISKMTMDHQYLERRRRIMLKQPQNAIDGLEQAGVAIYKGFEDGITGIVTQPMEGAEKEGVKGFLTGTVKGLTGAIVKPITGILDATSKTAAGLSNTVITIDDKPNEYKMRNPRTFYDCMEYYKGYQQDDSIFRLYCKNQRNLNNLHILDCIQLNGNTYLGVTRENLIKFNIKTMKTELIIEPDMIDEILYPNEKGQSFIDANRINSEESISSQIKLTNFIPYTPTIEIRRKTFKVMISYYQSYSDINIKQFDQIQSKKNIIELNIDNEERAQQLVQTLIMIKNKYGFNNQI